MAQNINQLTHSPESSPNNPLWLSRLKNVQVLQDFYNYHPPLWLLNMDPACLLSEKKVSTFGNEVPEETFPQLLLGAQDQRLGAEQDQPPCGSTGTSSDSCNEAETCMVQTCDTPRQPLQNHPSEQLGRWATPWSAEEMLDGKHQRADVFAHARTADNGLLQKKTGRGSLLNRPSCSPDEPIGQGTELNFTALNKAPSIAHESTPDSSIDIVIKGNATLRHFYTTPS